MIKALIKWFRKLYKLPSMTTEEQIELLRCSSSGVTNNKRTPSNVALEDSDGYIEYIASIHSNMYMSAEDKITYLASTKWKQLKSLRALLANSKCEYCDATNNLELHHITYAHLGNENIKDVVLLCSVCHNTLHNNAAKLYSNPYGRENIYPLYFLHGNNKQKG